MSLMAQEVPFTSDEIRVKITEMQKEAVHNDSLVFVEEGCQYFEDTIPFEGFIYHLIDETLTFNCFKDGRYTGEEWIFRSSLNNWNSDSLASSLQEFTVRSDTNEHFMVVTNFYDFKENRLHEIYIEKRILCAKRRTRNEAFDIIFGGDNRHRYPYKSFYENGDKKETMIKHRRGGWKWIIYTDEGKKEFIEKVSKKGRLYRKQLNEDGKCDYRYKVKGEDIKGLYAISHGRVVLTSFAKYQMNEDKRRDKRIKRYNRRRERRDARREKKKS